MPAKAGIHDFFRSERKQFFFEPFWASRFRLRFATSSGRENQKTFLLWADGHFHPHDHKTKKFLSADFAD